MAEETAPVSEQPEEPVPVEESGQAKARAQLWQARRRSASLFLGTLLLLAFSAVFAAVPGSDGWSGAAARGDDLAAQSRLLSAADWYQEAARRPGGNPAALPRLGSAYLKRGQWQDAARTLRLAEVAGASSPELFLGLAIAQDKAGDLRASLTTLRLELSLRPDDAEAWIQLVERAAQSGLRPAEIAQSLAGAPDPSAPPPMLQKALYLRGACLLGPDTEAGRRALQQAALGPDEKVGAAARELIAAVAERDGSGAPTSMARALLGQGLLGPALGYLDVEASGAAEAERQALLGYILMHTGQLDRAEEPLRRSQQLVPDLQIGQFILGSFLRAKGDAEGAARLLAKAARQLPPNPAVYLELANALVDTGDYGTAEQALSLAVQAAPESGELRLAIAEFYTDRQYRIEKALPEATEAAKLLGRSADSLSVLAWGLHLSGRSKEALAPMQEAVAKEPESAQLRYRLGSIYEELGRRSDAREQYLMVHELDASGGIWSRAQAALNGM